MIDRRIKIAPSILSADFSILGEQVSEAEAGGADYIHIDIMDGHFVPSLTFGPMIVKMIRNSTNLPFDVHKMVTDPQNYVSDLAAAGADMMTLHAESPIHLHRAVYQVKEAGMKVGVALSPATPASAIEEMLTDLDLVLVMTVNPGYGGQVFIETMLDKISRIRTMLDLTKASAELEVDGGIGPKNAKKIAEAGADVLVAGSAVYAADGSVEESITAIRSAVTCGP